MIERRTTFSGGGYPDESDSNTHGNRAHGNGRYPGKRKYYQERGGRPLERENNQNRGYPRRGRPPDGGGPLMMEDLLTMEVLLKMEDPLMMEDPLTMEDPLMMEDLLVMEDPQEMEDHQEDLEDKDH